MTTTNERRFAKREAWFAVLASFGLLAVLTLGANAQVVKDPADKDKKIEIREGELGSAGLLTEWTAVGRLGSPHDRPTSEGQLTPVGFADAEKLHKIPIMGGTVYCAVFRNSGEFDKGDAFATGTKEFENTFREGYGYRGNLSPRLDRKAKYLYLYQVVSDRGFDPRNRLKKSGEIKLALDEEINRIPQTQDIARFALRLLVSPQYITSWGYFTDRGFASNVEDMNLVGVGQKKSDLTSVSFLPSILTKHREPAYQVRAVSHPLGELQAGFRVDTSTRGIQASKAYDELKGNIRFVNTLNAIVPEKDQKRSAIEPAYVQVMYETSVEERLGVEGAADDDLTRAMFVVDFDWQNNKALKQGQHSVVFGFTSDLPPVWDRIRLDTKEALQGSQGLRLASYFADAEIGRIATVAQTNSNAMVSIGQRFATPAPAPAEAGLAGFAGITGGGFGGLGGVSGGGGGGGIGFPAFTGGYSRAGGGTGGGGGFGGGQAQQGRTGTDSGTTTNTGTTNTNTINFDATLTNQQWQAQAQFQFQNQRQNQNQNGRHHHGDCGSGGGNCGGGHVVPAPASVLLGLLGLPALYFLRRRKPTDTVEALA